MYLVSIHVHISVRRPTCFKYLRNSVRHLRLITGDALMLYIFHYHR